jgi:hypothetical protein
MHRPQPQSIVESVGVCITLVILHMQYGVKISWL